MLDCGMESRSFFDVVILGLLQILGLLNGFFGNLSMIYKTFAKPEYYSLAIR